MHVRTCTNCQVPKDESAFYFKGHGQLMSECIPCFKGRMSARHALAKLTLVQEHGGKCEHCGYDRDPRVLAFHHIDPATKLFGIAKHLSAPLSRLRLEAEKCILLCPNCHAEKHLGLW